MFIEREVRGRSRILALLVLAALAAPAARAQRFAADSFTLDNGLAVVVAPNHRVPAVTQMIWYKVGGADEPRGTSGIAHFLEHLMFRGTKETPPGAFSRIVAQNGGRDNAFTTHDYTAYFQNVAADRLELVMKLEAERMTDDDARVERRRVETSRRKHPRQSAARAIDRDRGFQQRDHRHGRASSAASSDAW